MKKHFAVMATFVAGLVWLAGIAFGQSAPATAEDLMKQVLTAATAKDQAALEKLTITEAEYRKYVWPNVAATASGSNAQKYWTMYQKTSAVGVTTNLKEFGGRKLELMKVSFDGPIKQTKAYRLLSGPAVVVRDESGQEKTVRLAGSVLEHDGGFKIANYFVRPRAAAK